MFFVCAIGFYYILSLGKWKIELESVFLHFFARGKRHRLGDFFRISLLVQMKPADSATRNCGKESTLTPFSRKGGKPPKRGLVQPRNSPSWVRAPTAKPSEYRQDGDAGLASPLGGGGICGANGGEGAVPFGRGRHSHETHSRGYGHRRHNH